MRVALFASAFLFIAIGNLSGQSVPNTELLRTQQHAKIRNIDCPNKVGSSNCVEFTRQYYPCLPYGLGDMNGKKAIINDYSPAIGYVAIVNSASSPSIGHVGIVVEVTNDYVVLLQGGQGCELRAFLKSKIAGYWRPACASDLNLERP